MRRFPNSDLFATSLLFFAMFVISLPIAAQGPPNPNAPGRGPNTGTIQQRYSGAGMVSDADSHTRIDSVRWDLRAITHVPARPTSPTRPPHFQLPHLPTPTYK